VNFKVVTDVNVTNERPVLDDDVSVLTTSLSNTTPIGAVPDQRS
jgi:hypothetical protein